MRLIRTVTHSQTGRRYDVQADLPTAWGETFGCAVYEEGREVHRGAPLALAPDWADIGALQGCYSTGEPKGVHEHAWYWLAGALELKDVYVRGGVFPDQHTPSGCVRELAKLLRMPESAVGEWVRVCRASTPNHFNGLLRRKLNELIEAERPRWRKEAFACLLAHASEMDDVQ